MIKFVFGLCARTQGRSSYPVAPTIRMPQQTELLRPPGMQNCPACRPENPGLVIREHPVAVAPKTRLRRSTAGYAISPICAARAGHAGTVAGRPEIHPRITRRSKAAGRRHRESERAQRKHASHLPSPDRRDRMRATWIRSAKRRHFSIKLAVRRGADAAAALRHLFLFRDARRRAIQPDRMPLSPQSGRRAHRTVLALAHGGVARPRTTSNRIFRLGRVEFCLRFVTNKLTLLLPCYTGEGCRIRLLV